MLAAWCLGVWLLVACGFCGVLRVTLLRCFARICFGDFGGCWVGCVVGLCIRLFRFGLPWFLGWVGALCWFVLVE